MLSSFRFSFRSITYESIMSYSLNREARMLDRLLKKGVKKQTQSKKIAAEFFCPEKESFNRKGAALNKVYMEHVSEALAVGRNSDLLFELGIQITKVQLTSDRSTIKAYWACSNNKVQDEEILDALNRAAGDVKDHINNLRYIGSIPQLKFVKDREAENTRNIERLLAVADFGRDFQPTYPSPAFKSGPNLDIEEPLPQMRQDVLGLDHAKITRRLLASVDKAKMKVNLPKGEINFDQEACSSMKIIPFDKGIYQRFFKKKFNQEMKAKKEMRAKLYGKELVEDEYEEEYEHGHEHEYEYECEYEYEYEYEYKNEDKERIGEEFEENFGSKNWKPPFVK